MSSEKLSGMLLLCLLAFHTTSTCGRRALEDVTLHMASDEQVQLDDAELIKAVEDSTDFIAVHDNQSEIAKVHASNDAFQEAEGGNNQSAEIEQGQNPATKKMLDKLRGMNPPALEILYQKYNYNGVKDWVNLRWVNLLLN